MPKQKRTRPQPPVSKVADDGSSSSSVNQNQQTRTDGQHILQSLASHGSALNSRNANGPPQRPLPSSNPSIDVAGLMSQALQSPALNGLLEGVSQQTGVDSPDGLRNMLQQFTQSPQLMNTVNQIVQQVGSQDVGNMFAGAERGQGGGIDISRMFQQMMPIVSQALGGANPSSLFSVEEAEPGASYQDGTVNRDEYSDNQTSQVCIHLVTEFVWLYYWKSMFSNFCEFFRTINFLTYFGSRWKSSSTIIGLVEGVILLFFSIYEASFFFWRILK